METANGKGLERYEESASRVVESSLTPEAQKKLVHEFIDSLPPSRS